MAIAVHQPQTIDLRIERLNRTILRLAAPSIMESVLTTVVYLVDTILIGWLNDPVALAAVGLSSTLMWAADGLFQAISISASAMVARFWGRRDFEMAREVAGQSLTLSVLVALVLMSILMPIARWFLEVWGENPMSSPGGPNMCSSSWRRPYLLFHSRSRPALCVRPAIRKSPCTLPA